MKTIVKLSSVVVAGVLSLGTVGAVPAQAAAAPGCAKVKHWTGRVTQSVKVTNNCGHTISFQIKRRGPDPRCTVLANGRSSTWQWTRWGGQWQGIRWNCA